MAITKTINIKVNDGELEGLEQNLNQVSSGFDKVDNSAEKASTSLSDVGKNGGAIATLDRLTGGLASQVRDAAESTKLLNFSLKGTRTALIATGIGAFVVALGVVVAYWDDIVDLITGANKALEKQGDLLDRNINTLETERALLEKQRELVELRGGSTTQLIAKEEKLLNLQKEQTRQLIENLELQLEKEKSTAREVDFWTFLQTRGRASQSQITEEEQDRIDALQERLDRAKLSLVEIDIALEKVNEPAITPSASTGGRRDRVSGVNEVDRNLRTLRDPLEEAFNQELELTNIQANALAERSKNEQAYTEFLQREAEERKQIEENVNQAKLDAFYNTTGAIIQILGENSAAGKAAAIAQATINTFLGASDVISAPSTLPEPIRTINKIASVASIIATGLQQVKAITSTKLPSFASDSGGGGASVVQAPAFNVVGTSGINQLAESLQNDDNPIRAYVTSGDINSGGELERNRIETATLS